MIRRIGIRHWLYIKAKENIFMVFIVDTLINFLLGVFIQQKTGIEWYEGMTFFTQGIKLPMFLASFICLEFISAIIWSAIDDKYLMKPIRKND